MPVALGGTMTTMDTDALVSPNAAAGSAAAELNELINKRTELMAQLRDSERSARFGSEAVGQAREALTTAERRRLVGEVGASETRKAEAALANTRAASQEPWGERVEAARLALRDVDHQVGRLIADRLDELLACLDEEAQRVTDRANDALAEVVAVYREREAVAQRIDALAGTIRRPKFGDVSPTRLASIARAATALLEADPPGEVKPAFKADPRLPRGGSIPAAPESWEALHTA
jgi:hypothetical protein